MHRTAQTSIHTDTHTSSQLSDRFDRTHISRELPKEKLIHIVQTVRLYKAKLCSLSCHYVHSFCRSPFPSLSRSVFFLFLTSLSAHIHIVSACCKFDMLLLLRLALSLAHTILWAYTVWEWVSQAERCCWTNAFSCRFNSVEYLPWLRVDVQSQLSIRATIFFRLIFVCLSLRFFGFFVVPFFLFLQFVLL